MIILSIDPGIDRLSVAVFDVAQVSRTMTIDAKVRAWVDMMSVTTRPDEPMEARLATVGHHVAELTYRTRARLVLIERPRFAGAYKGRRARFGARTEIVTGIDMSKLWMSIGAVTAGAADGIRTACSGGRVEFAPAASMAKKDRLTLTRRLLEMGGKKPPTNSDDLDAVGIGLGAMWDV